MITNLCVRRFGPRRRRHPLGGHLLVLLFPLLLLPLELAAQSMGVIRGQVTDGATGAPLASAQISLADSPQGVLSNESGHYVLRVPNGDHQLEVRYMGYRHDAAAVTVRSGETLTLDLQMEPSYVQLGEIVVTAGFEGRARSLNEMNAAVGIKNVVFDEQFERMPDETVADALSRVPGMASTFDSNTGYLGYEGDVPETSELSLRGLAPGMLAVTIDGQRVPSTSSEGRGVELAGMSLKTIQSIEVVKAVTPDIDADAAAGAINLRSRPPTEFHAAGDVSGGYNGLVGTSDYRGSLSVGNRIGPVGFLVSGSYSRLRPGTDIVSNSWADREFGGDTEMVIRRFTMTNSQADRERISLNTTAAWELGSGSELNFRGAFSDYSNDISTQFLQLRPGTFRSPLETVGGQVRRRGLFTDTRTHTWSAMLGGEHPVGGAVIDYGAGYARSENSRPEYLLIENRMNGVDLVYDRSDPLFTRFEVTSGQNLFAPENYFVTSTQRRDDSTYDEDRSLTLNVTLPPLGLGGAPLTVKAGAKYTDKTRDRDYLRYFPAPADYQLWMTEVTTDSEFRSISPGDYRIGYTVDRQRARAFMDKYQATFGTNIDEEESDAGNYAAQERIHAGYVMGTAEFGPLTVIAGGRLEISDNRYVGMETVFGPEGEYIGTRELDSGSDHSSFYPGVHLRYELDPRNALRFAWTNTISRPAFNELAPTENVSYESNRVSRGNPDLLPTASMNLDAQYDWYGALGDHVSIGAFYKDLTDFTGRETTIIDAGPYAGFELVEWANFGDARTYGVETSVYKRLGFLPGPLRSLGLNANYTWSGSETDFTQGRELPLPNQSPHTANVGLDFDYGPFASSLAAQYQSARLRHIGADERYDMYLSRPLTVDFSASLELRTGLEAFTQISNLTGTPTYLYAGNNHDYPQRASFSEPIWMIGTRYTF